MPVVNSDESPIKIPASLKAALVITVVITLAAGVTNLLPELSTYQFSLGK